MNAGRAEGIFREGLVLEGLLPRGGTAADRLGLFALCTTALWGDNFTGTRVHSYQLACWCVFSVEPSGYRVSGWFAGCRVYRAGLMRC